jgi:bifunctional pyridoxal-dependent enzyme with beta-cystathionase and maltose regulon repressor activities
MGRRWTAEDIANIKNLAQQHPLPLIAEKMDRSVGAVVFKAHKLKVPLRNAQRKRAEIFA